MEINPDNFQDALPVVEELLQKCEYVAVDFEFSGIDHQKESGTDGDAASVDQLVQALIAPSEEQYAAKREGLRGYTILQIGLSIFVRDAADGSAIPLPTYLASGLQPLEQEYGIFDIPQLKELQEAVKQLGQMNCAANVALLQSLQQSVQKALVAQRQEAELIISARHPVGGRSGNGSGSGEKKETAEAASGANSTTTTTTTAASPAASSEECVPLLASLSSLQRMDCLTKMLRLLLRWQRELPAWWSDGKSSMTPSSVYKAYTFSAHLFPAPYPPFEDIRLQSEAIGEFLRDNQMDFNKWVRAGLRFTTLARYLEWRQAEVASESQALLEGFNPGEMVDGFKATFGAAFDDLLPLSKPELDYLKFVMQATDNRKEQLDKAQAMILYSRDSTGAPSGWLFTYLTDRVQHQRECVVLRALGLRKANRAVEHVSPSSGGGGSGGGGGAGSGGASSKGGSSLADGTSLASNFYGTQLLAAVLQASGQLSKPVILHNGLSDLMFFFQALYGTLPPTLPEFKQLVSQHLPQLYDTRTLTSIPRVQYVGNCRGRLETTYKEFTHNVRNRRPLIVFDWAAAGGSDPSKTLSSHDAGYDAFITGSLFAHVRDVLVAQRIPLSPYAGVVPQYGSVIALDMKSPKVDVVFNIKDTPMVYVHTSTKIAYVSDTIAIRAEKEGLSTSFMYTGEGYIMTLCNTNLTATGAAEAVERLRQLVQVVLPKDCVLTMQPIPFGDLVKAGKLRVLDPELLPSS